MKGRILAGWAQKSSKPYLAALRIMIRIMETTKQYQYEVEVTYQYALICAIRFASLPMQLTLDENHITKMYDFIFHTFRKRIEIKLKLCILSLW